MKSKRIITKKQAKRFIGRIKGIEPSFDDVIMSRMQGLISHQSLDFSISLLKFITDVDAMKIYYMDKHYQPKQK